VVANANGKPTIAITGSNPVRTKQFSHSFYKDAGATCTTRDGDDLSESMQTDDSSVEWNKIGEYKIFYTCKDPKTGLSFTKARRVKIEGNSEGPTITVTGDDPVHIGDTPGEKYQDEGATCKDDIEGNIRDVNTDFSVVDFDTPGTYNVKYTCQNKVGAKSEATREIIVGGELVPTPMPTTHTNNEKNKGCKEEVKQYCGEFDYENTDNSDKCLQCVKDHIGRIDKGLSSICGLSDLAYMCDTSMAGKTQEETKECETQVKNKCGSVVERGPKCMACVQSHISDIDGGLVGSNMCSRFQLNNFCYFYGEGKSLDPGLEKFDKENGIAKSKKTVKKPAEKKTVKKPAEKKTAKKPAEKKPV
jgi:hypothetical protein